MPTEHVRNHGCGCAEKDTVKKLDEKDLNFSLVSKKTIIDCDIMTMHLLTQLFVTEFQQKTFIVLEYPPY